MHIPSSTSKSAAADDAVIHERSGAVDEADPRSVRRSSSEPSAALRVLAPLRNSTTDVAGSSGMGESDNATTSQRPRLPANRLKPPVAIHTAKVLPQHMQDIASSSHSIGSHTAIHHEEITVENAPSRINPLGEAGNAAVIDMPTEHELHRDLMAHSKAFVEEDRIVLNPEHVQAFVETRAHALKTGDWTQAKQCFHTMLNLDQHEMDAGFREGGKAYSWRNAPASILSLLPTIFTFKAHGKAPVPARNLAVGYFGSVMAASTVSSLVNTYTLLHVTPYQDMAFRNAADIAPELNTPTFDKIETELKQVLQHVQDESPRLQELLTRSVADPENQALRDAANHAVDEVAKTLDHAINHYTTRCQLNRVYFEGLHRQSCLQTLKFYGNLLAGWGGYIAKDPRVAAGIQIATSISQLVLQRLVAPSDEVDKQNLMIDLKMLTADDPGKFKELMRSPLQIRVKTLDQIFTGQVRELEQQIADTLNLGANGPNEWRTHVTLKDRAEYPARLAAVSDIRSAAFESLGGAAKAEVQALEIELASAMVVRNYERADELHAVIAGRLKIDAGVFKKYASLQAQANKFPPLSDAEQEQLELLSNKIETACGGLPDGPKSKFDTLISAWESTRHDPQHVREGRFTEVSDYNDNKRTVHDGMQVTEHTNLFELSPEFKVGFVKAGNTRSGLPDEVSATYGAASWRAFQLGVAGINGSLMINSLLGMVSAQKKTYDHTYHEPLWERYLSLGVTMSAVLVNVAAAYQVANAKTKPLGKLWGQVASGPTSSISETVYQNNKLDERRKIREATAQGAYPYVGVSIKSLSTYCLDALKLGFKGMAFMPRDGIAASKARAAFEKAEGKQKELEQMKNGRLQPDRALNISDDTAGQYVAPDTRESPLPLLIPKRG
ncbi:hypothetical protein V8G57_00255 [Collimonas sp. H4R21]|uniref:Uncharacterized protein n=1 Tax=Collimonas rhizosphaerae TaxID=3126357 RepID=A0ABU9PP82_9BURK